MEGLTLRRPPPPGKKAKKAVLFFEVEILDAKTREKLCFLDKVCGVEGGGRAQGGLEGGGGQTCVSFGGVGRGVGESGCGFWGLRRWSRRRPSLRSRTCSPKRVWMGGGLGGWGVVGGALMALGVIGGGWGPP